MILGGFYLNDLNERVQLPVISEPTEADIDEIVTSFRDCVGYLGLRVTPIPMIGPYELIFIVENGYYFLMLSAYLDDGDVGVRTLKKTDNGGGEVEIYGDLYQEDFSTRDVGKVIVCFKDFLRNQDVYPDIFESG